MKTILRILMLGIFMAALTAVGATNIFAQDVCTEVEAKQALYKQFTDNYASTDLDKKQAAVDAGKQYTSKYGACADDKPIVDYLNKNIPDMEKFIAGQKSANQTKALYTNFDAAVKGSKTADIFSNGKQILAQQPDFLDVIIVLASAGFDQAIANPPVNTFNDDTVTYSKMAIDKIEGNTASKTGNYGALQYSYKTKDYPDAKSNALGAMNYNIGYIMYYRQGKDNPDKKKEALNYFYKSLQYNSFPKKDPTVYQAIGAWYLDQAIKIDTDRTAKIKANSGKETEETLAMVADQKGYADRSIDAYARAYKLAKDDKNQKKEYVDGLYDTLKKLYAFRYDGKTEGIDAYVATVMSKPLVDPTTPITPVKEAVPTPTTTPTTPSGTSQTMSSDTNTGGGTTARQTTTTSSGANTTTTTKTDAKKPAPKKKGTR